VTAVYNIQEEFLDKLGNVNRIDLLLTKVTNVYFFAKDYEGRVMLANQLTVERCGCKTEEELIGKTDYDLFSFDLADKYRKDELAIMQAGEAVYDMTELAPNKDGIIDCYFTNKIPLYDKEERVIGIAGVSSSHAFLKKSLDSYLKIAPALEKIRDNIDHSISVPELAQSVGLTQRKFGEYFKEIFKLTPQTYILKMRIHFACEELTKSNTPLAEIAHSVGFYDHSTFTHQFTKHMNVRPTEYRKLHKT